MTSQAVLTVVPESFHLVAAVSEDSTLQITNISFVPAMFRLMTTNPARYIVKSHKGIIMPCCSEAVNVSLHRSHCTENALDDFKLEYAALPSGVNPADVKPKEIGDLLKATPREGLFKKIVKCRVTVPHASVTAPERVTAASEKSNVTSTDVRTEPSVTAGLESEATAAAANVSSDVLAASSPSLVPLAPRKFTTVDPAAKKPSSFNVWLVCCVVALLVALLVGYFQR
jgi:hypothetical protein